MTRDTEILTTRTFDVAVIGGGIHGACTAWDAALRGLSTVVVERDDFGGGTSANSLKIMHGGLRYLQDGSLRRARSSSRERAILLRTAPHLVQPLRFLIPIYAGGKHGRLVFRAGMALNDCLSWDRNRGVDARRRVPRGRVVSREEALRLCPWLSRDGLRGGATWYDGLALNSERLTLAFLQGAAERGATVVNYAELIGFLRRGSRIVGLRVEDRVSGGVLEVHARATINATGPRLEKVVSLAKGTRPDSGVEPAHLAKAVNLVWRREVGDTAAGVFSDLERKDDPAGSQGRYLFAVPWNGFTMLGTWYRLVGGDADEGVGERDLREPLEEINGAWPGLGVRWEDLSFYHCGLLPVSGGRRAGSTPGLADSAEVVDHEARDGLAGLFSILGPKYTTARLVAERALDRVVRKERLSAGKCRTPRTALNTGELPTIPSLAEFGLPGQATERLATHYGSELEGLLQAWARDGDLVPVTETSSWLRGEIVHAVRREMAIRLDDIVFRRTAMGAGACPAPSELEAVARIMAGELGWDGARRESEIRRVVNRYRPLPVSAGARS